MPNKRGSLLWKLSEDKEFKFEYMHKTAHLATVISTLIQASFYFADKKFFGIQGDTALYRFIPVVFLVIYCLLENSLSSRTGRLIADYAMEAVNFTSMFAMTAVFTEVNIFAYACTTMMMIVTLLAISFSAPFYTACIAYTAVAAGFAGVTFNTREIAEAMPAVLLIGAEVIGSLVCGGIFCKVCNTLSITQKQLEEDACRDALTGLFNRQIYKKLCSRNGKLSRAYTGIIMCDIDYFKQINDTHGHVAGDEALKRVAKVLKQSIRDNDIATRYGGEEFVLLLQEAPVDMLILIAKRIRENLEKSNEGEEIQPTLSIGVCAVNPDRTLDENISTADEGIYYIKENGRNGVSLVNDEGVKAFVDTKGAPKIIVPQK